MCVTFALGYAQSFYLTSIGVPGFVTACIGLALGLTLPGTILKWILKEELEAEKSVRREED